MLLMEPDGSIEACTTSSSTATTETSLGHILLLTDQLGQKIAAEVQAMVDAKLLGLAERLTPVSGGARWSIVGMTG